MVVGQAAATYAAAERAIAAGSCTTVEADEAPDRRSAQPSAEVVGQVDQPPIRG